LRKLLSVIDFFGYAIILIVSITLPFIGFFFGVNASLFFVGIMIGVPAVLYSIENIKAGTVLLLVLSFFLIRLGQMIPNIPFGIIIDIFICTLLLGVLLKRWKKGNFDSKKNTINLFVWVWLLYNVFEFFNPQASREAWFYVIRTIAVRTLIYFIVIEAIEDVKFLKTIIIIWISFSFLGAIYGLFQEFHGLLDSEKAWLLRDEERFKLFFNWGRFRIFSFFSDPTVFGILMAFSGLFCITIVNMPSLKTFHKIILLLFSITMFLSTVYSGTRTAFAMIPAGFLFFAILTFQKRTLILTSIILALGAFIIFSDIRSLGPLIGANPLERVRSAFRPNEDPSYLIRKENQERIKPYIQSHPFGSGVGSIGIWGERFSPNSALAGFAPDSTYVRVAVELGWVGLIIYCGFLGSVLYIGIKNHFKLENKKLKAYSASSLAVIYAIVIANYPQQAVIQVPNIFIFYILIASIVKLPEFDKKLSLSKK
jgi:putative inorganic carbon (hco3(-)) transporter